MKDSLRIVVSTAMLVMLASNGALAAQRSQSTATPALRDDFTSKQWGTGTTPNNSGEYSDNALRAVVYTKDWFIWTTPNNQAYGDNHMEVTVRSNGTDSDTAFGFMCHQQSQKDSFYYLVMTPRGQYAIGKSQEG